ncbi:uncharacterized protein BX664DRAFT_279651 [Halteromyces radiatus]|uniref:uncharacterized protein n=1 Tax=Halteromyces radiatus TaxID=101107 RepID=UPI00221E81D8|nr:uncharacterized protein BX664DRAFT_279651 [Halteromyces radiatus]KAI8088966.1 hypothetical protein BX664DRAFT_279651 [Halteromyces radiatus]
MDDIQEMERVRRKFDQQLQRMFGGTMSEMNSQLRSILNNLKTQNDPTIQLVTLQELAEILSVSNEETLAGYFATDSFVKELVRIMKGSEQGTDDDIPPGLDMDEDTMLALAMAGGFGGGNPEIMLLACRCLSNLMDAMPTAVTNVVYQGATKVLCQKLKSIEYIDLAEQALTALEKIASQLPRAVIHEGGLSAVLMYFDFFSIHSQRTALRTAANCMRCVDKDNFSQVLEVIPTLMNTITYSDRTLVELSCLCWLRITENYRPRRDLIEKAVSVELLKAIIDLIPIPGNPNAARPSTFMDLLRILRAIVKSSPSLCCELLKLNIVDIFYKVLTGSTDIPQYDHASSSLPEVNMDHKWRDSVYTILKIIIDSLPPLPKDDKFSSRRFKDLDRNKLRDGSTKDEDDDSNNSSNNNHKNDLRAVMFRKDNTILHYINSLLIPLLLEMHTSMVNIRVRQLVTHILVKLIHFSEADELRKVLNNIGLSGFLASILTQQEHPILVTDTLYMAEMLIEKLPDIYVFLFQHEGVIHEIKSLANTPLSDKEDATAADHSCDTTKNDNDVSKTRLVSSTPGENSEIQQQEELRSLEEKLQSARRRLFNREDLPALLRSRMGLLQQQQQQQQQLSADTEKGIGQGSTRKYIIQLANYILKTYQDRLKLKNSSQTEHAVSTIESSIAELDHNDDDTLTDLGLETLHALLDYYKSCSVGISSYELRASGLMDALLEYLTTADNVTQTKVDDDNLKSSLSERQALFKYIIGNSATTTMTTGGGDSGDGNDIISMLIIRLQELLARFEQYQVVTPLDMTSNDGLRNPSSMLAKQIRLRLTGIGSNIPIDHQHLMVSTHAVATFRVIEEYLLSRVTHSDGGLDEDGTSDNGGDEIITARHHDRPTLNETSSRPSLDQLIQQDNDIDNTIRDNSESLKNESGGDSNNDTDNSVEASGSTSVSNKGRWRIIFSTKSNTINNDMTIYGAIHKEEIQQRQLDSPPPTRNIWISSYPISYKLVWTHDDGKKNGDEDIVKDDDDKQNQRLVTKSSSPSFSTQSSQSDESSANNQICDNVRRLLKVIYQLYNGDDQPNLRNLFFGRKLTAKVNRQLEEPLIVASDCLPEWIHRLLRDTPFLFPFETRYLYIQCTSYGYSRLISRWQSLQMRNQQHQGARGGTLDDSHQQQSMTLGQLERQKVRMMRNQILESAVKMLELFATSDASLEIEFVDEEGTGLGPTLEFYALASKAFCKKSLGLWHNDDDDSATRYVCAPRGLFPRPLLDVGRIHNKTVRRITTLFKTLGRFVAKAMLDFRIIDIPFSLAFFHLVFNNHLRAIDLIRSSQQKQEAIETIEVDGITLDDLCLSYTLPGSNIHLKDEGDKIPVTIHNLANYVDLLVDATVGSGVSKQIDAFRTGFSESFPINDLKILTCDELVSLFGTSDEDWSLTTLMDTIKADHGFTMDSTAMQHLLEILSELDHQGRRDFLQFTTGSPRLPIGGWKALRPPFTVVRKMSEPPLSANDYLPSVMTCANYFKMPDYSDKATMLKRLQTAMSEGKESFLLS